MGKSVSVSLTHTWRDLADCGRVPAVALVTVGALDKDGAVAKTLSKHFSADVIQSHTTAWKKTETGHQTPQIKLMPQLSHEQ